MKTTCFLLAATILIGFCILPGSAMALSNASLSGDYIFVGYYRDVGLPNAETTYIIEMSFDGAGNVSFYDQGDDSHGSGTYSVSPNGRLSADVADSDGQTTLYGIVNHDGSIINMVDMDSATDDDVNLLAGIKTSSWLSDSILNGDYIFVNYYGDVGLSDSDDIVLIKLNFDGAGNLSFYDQGDDVHGTGTYSVALNGEFTATVADNDGQTALHGIVNSDGSVINMIDMDFAADDDVNLLAGIKASDMLSESTLTGNYIFVLYYCDVGPSNADDTALIEMSFDGKGNLTSYDQKDDAHGTGTYSVASNGSFSATVVDNDGQTELHGIVNSDGSIINMADLDDSADDDVGLLLGVRMSEIDIIPVIMFILNS